MVRNNPYNYLVLSPTAQRLLSILTRHPDVRGHLTRYLGAKAHANYVQHYVEQFGFQAFVYLCSLTRILGAILLFTLLIAEF